MRCSLCSSCVSVTSILFQYLSMSRQYHVLGDTRTCTRCDSPCALFGQRDVETSWFGWCVLCNTTWHNRRIESVLTSVSRNFGLRSLAALVGDKKAASVTLTFLQTSVCCVKYNNLLRHYLNVRVLMWLCCPLEWWYEEDSEAEEERIRRPVLRTLHETAISSRAFKAMCFPCIQSKDRSWTLLHAVCSYLRRSQTAHTCDKKLEKEQALKAIEEAKKGNKRETKKEENKEAKKRKSWPCV